MWNKVKHVMFRPVDGRILRILTYLAAGWFLVYQLVTCVYDYDIFFLIATGEKIVNNGIPYVNPWSMDQLGFIAQQWLYDVLIYILYSSAGRIGLVLFMALQCTMLAMVLYRCIALHGFTEKYRLLFVFISMAVCSGYVFSIRPETVTLLLLALECYMLELFVRKGKTWLLWVLPVLMFLEVNLHASMWPFHFCVLLAYVVPVFWHKSADNRTAYCLLSQWKQVLVCIIAMGAFLLLNPYGVDGVLYLWNTNRSGAMGLVAIQEMLQTEIFSYAGIPVILCILLLLWCLCKKHVTNQAAYMAVGFLLLSGISERNSMFLVLPVLFLFRDAEFAPVVFIQIRYYLGRILCTVLAVCAVICMWKAAPDVRASFGPLVTEDTFVAGFLSKICHYIRENGGEGSRIFTGFNTGAYLEFEGFHNIYMDARPELYMKQLNGAKDVLAEYSRYACYGMIPAFDRKTMPAEWRHPVASDDMQAWLDGYQFDYLVVMPGSECNLAGWLLNDRNYRLVEECSGGGVVLYERTGGMVAE